MACCLWEWPQASLAAPNAHIFTSALFLPLQVSFLIKDNGAEPLGGCCVLRAHTAHPTQGV